MIHALWKALHWSVVLIVVFLVCAWLVASGCQRMEKGGKHWESSWSGLNRTITLYTDDGRVLHRWNAKTYIETDPPVVAFIDSSGREIKIEGGIVLVEERR
jgi:hypothetical protein